MKESALSLKTLRDAKILNKHMAHVTKPNPPKAETDTGAVSFCLSSPAS